MLLLAGHDRMCFIMRAAKAGFWEYDMQTNTNIWSEEAWQLYGLKSNNAESSFETWINTIVSLDIERVELAVQESVKTGAEYNCRE